MALAVAIGTGGLGWCGNAAAGRVQIDFGSLPLAFEANRGQAGHGVRFLARAGGYTLRQGPLR